MHCGMVVVVGDRWEREGKRMVLQSVCVYGYGCVLFCGIAALFSLCMHGVF